jgi:uncharacterized Fe-S cluster protein YjdI/CDGSH-type Zn-finger protein
MEGRTVVRRTYCGSSIEVSFDVALCIHATECVLGLPAVFDRDQRPWIRPDNATPEEVSLVVERCPTGALLYHRLDGVSDEQTRQVTVVTSVENGPLAVRGDLVVRRGDGWFERLPRAAFCRCGQSKNKPFCDGSHRESGFDGAGSMTTPESPVIRDPADPGEGE